MVISFFQLWHNLFLVTNWPTVLTYLPDLPTWQKKTFLAALATLYLPLWVSQSVRSDQTITSFLSYTLFLPSYHTKPCCIAAHNSQLLTTFDSFWQLLTTFDNFWQLLATFGILWQIVENFGNFWLLLTTFDNFWHFVSNCGNFW